MGGMDVNAKLTLDSSNFDGNMKKSADNATATGRAAAKAAREAAAAQVLASKFAGDAVQEESLKKIQAFKVTKAAADDYRNVQKAVAKGSLNEAEGANAAAAAYERLVVARKLEAALTPVAHPAISDRMAASGLVRGLEGNPGIRSAENVLSTIPGAAGAAQALYPLIGGAALGGMFIKTGEELYEVEKKAANAGKAINQVFSDMHAHAQVANDDLAIENDRLGDSIAKLSGHPGNGLETSLDKGRKKADELVVSLQNDRKELAALLSEHEVGFFGGMLSGVSNTGKQSSEINKDQENLAGQIGTARDAFFDETDGVKDPARLKAATNKRNTAVRTAYQSQIETYRAESKRLRDEQIQGEKDAEAAAIGGGVAVSGPDNSAKIANIDGRLRSLKDALRREQLIESIGARDEVEGQLKGGKESAEAAKKAAELKLKAMEGQLAAYHLLGERSAKFDFDYWDAQRLAFKAGSEQYNQIVEKQAQLALQGAEKAHQTIARFRAEQKTLAGIDAPLGDPMRGWNNDNARAMDDRFDANREMAAIQTRNAARLAEVQVGEASGRTMTRNAAAAALAAVHTREYGAELERLLARQKDIAGATYLNGHEDERQRQLATLEKEIANVKAGRQVQQQQDAFAMAPGFTSATVGAADALNLFVEKTRDLAGQMESIVNGTLEGVNRTLVTELTTRSHGHGRHLWTDTGHDLATTATGGLLKNAEGIGISALQSTGIGSKLFGLGGGKKPTGSAGDPLHVMVMNGLGPVPGAEKLLDGLTPPSGSGGAASLAMTTVGKLLPFIPGFADGIDNFGGGLAVVGEKGPELLNLPRGSGVIPNHRMASGTSGFGLHYAPVTYITGNADPAQVRAVVDERMRAHLPGVVEASKSHYDDQKRRSTTHK
jgi:hypothetical protein